ncbi:uncharacterized protein LOC100830521 [Brachypodium distachyon]|uniref:Uncharacterized protein n=1 Tax=Brachypodium distachyon TaxID=15368 RepID=I1HYH7_BRADI|nr:uncharacterized protein LOC100830521 [Brachypodium distachyon]KQJ93918.1 hypothetical protein BRADI_3g07480v3 [Brachypodium distachyon]|eukprot:XP_003571088.1 uncharacterized protein LOC100830521 [Brachypodium distachyon]
MAGPSNSGVEVSAAVPAWLLTLLGVAFFQPCPAHLGVPRNECNHYCIDCSTAGPGNNAVFCSLCLRDHAVHHQVLQIRRSSYSDVIRVAEAEEVADVSLVQTYVINADRVVFLNPRPTAPGHGSKCVGAAGTCLECPRALIDAAFCFCSLGCKLKGMGSDPALTFALEPDREGAAGPSGQQVAEPSANEHPEATTQGAAQFQRPGQTSYRRLPRKGVKRQPERAPFF